MIIDHSCLCAISKKQAEYKIPANFKIAFQMDGQTDRWMDEWTNPMIEIPGQSEMK